MSSRSSELRLRVRQERPFPFDAELSCAGGELLALVGPSGSGKSTLLRMIAGLSQPGSGVIECGDRTWFDSQAGVKLSPQQRRVGYVPQHYGLFPHLSALANVEAGLGHLPRAERVARARTWLAKVHLAGLESRRPAELSGGQQQRVALARALALEPVILLLDEPFSAVDRATRETLYLELAELKQELALPIVMVTHDLAEALLLADRMTLLDHGSTLQTGIPSEVMVHPASVTAARLMGLRNILPGRMLRHEPAEQRSWIEAGPLRIAVRHRPDIDQGVALHWVIPSSAIQLPGTFCGPLRESPNRASLTVTRLLQMGEEVRLTAELQGIAEPVYLQLTARLTQSLKLSHGITTDVIIDETQVHLIAAG